MYLVTFSRIVCNLHSIVLYLVSILFLVYFVNCVHYILRLMNIIYLLSSVQIAPWPSSSWSPSSSVTHVQGIVEIFRIRIRNYVCRSVAGNDRCSAVARIVKVSPANRRTTWEWNDINQSVDNDFLFTKISFLPFSLNSSYDISSHIPCFVNIREQLFHVKETIMAIENPGTV